jgi:CRP/FNR family transcriptional regulator, nitrogen oxide reductase regulator
MKEDRSRILKQTPIFASLDESALEELAGMTVEHICVPSQTIFREGDKPDWFYIVVEGRVKVYKLASSGKEIILAFFSAGEMFGEAAVFENQPYPASAATASASRLLGIRNEDLIRLLLKHPAVSLGIISLLSGRLRESQGRLRDLAGERVEQRLARLLLMLSGRLGGPAKSGVPAGLGKPANWSRPLPFTRQDLSDMAGTTTETTIRILSHWQKQKIISSVRGKITITDEIKLKQLAEGPAGM